MANGINLILIKGDKGYDISELVSEIKWSGRKGSSARSIDVTLIDDEDRSQRAGIDVTKGHQCIFSYDGKELFRGIIMQVKQADTKKCTFKAYDNGIYLANNKDTFKYTDKTVEQIFKDICSRFGIPYSKADSSNFKIPELTKSKTTAWDALCDAMSQVYSSTGVRHYIDSDKGSLRLQKRQDNIKQWVLETGANIITYSNTVSIEKVKTRIKAVSSEGNTVAEKKDTTLEKTIGIMQEIIQPDEELNSGQLNNLVAGTLKEKSTPERTLKIEAIGETDVISGIGVYIVIPALGLNTTYYVDEDTHTFSDNYHKMSVTLNLANDAEYDRDWTKTQSSGSSGGSSSGGNYKVGDIVSFKGGYHYVSSDAKSATGGKRSAGKAKITYTNKGAKHPYHLVGGAYTNVDGNCNVYGWVDSDTFS